MVWTDSFLNKDWSKSQENPWSEKNSVPDKHIFFELDRYDVMDIQAYFLFPSSFQNHYPPLTQLGFALVFCAKINAREKNEVICL